MNNLTILNVKSSHTLKQVSLALCLLSCLIIFPASSIQAQIKREIEIDYKSHKLKFSSILNDRKSSANFEQGMTENKILLDSIYLTENNGDKTKHKRVFYSYISGKITKTVSLLFDENGYYENVIETQLYNNEELVEEINIEMPWYMHNPIYHDDSTIITVYEEELEYENSLLQKRTTKRKDWTPDVTYEFYDYNEQNKIEYYKYKTWSELYETLYFYDNNGDKIYEVYMPFSDVYQVKQFVYEHNNDTLNTYRNESYYMYTEPLLDTVNTWRQMVKFTEVFDDNGRQLYLSQQTLKESWTYLDDYEANFEYNNEGQLLHASYSMILENEATEILRITNTYNEHNLISTSRREFYNKLVNIWETEEHKDYYYSSHLVGVLETKPQQLNIYPNPTIDHVNINNSDLNDQPYIVYNINGLIVSQGKLQNYTIDVSQLKKGLYFIKIADKQRQYNAKIIKQ
ncbi:MAG: T9SS type A sorting domain-containing protein [Salinivirgaceae bacterium]|jgi:hypothetical protein|nr:T9SS type A sorting domain-containing protein [Salinivirgaceae bacterium]